MSKFSVIINDNFGYNINSIVDDAIAKWDLVIVSLPSYVSSMNLTINIEDLDDNILGNASPTAFYYDSNGNSVLDSGEEIGVTGGVITFNNSKIVSMKNEIRNDGNSTLYYVVLHEIGHVLGIGVWWNHFNFVTDYTNFNNVTKKYYNGTNALREYRNYMQNQTLTGIPIEDDGGEGTKDSHAEEGNNIRKIDGQIHGGLNKELMTGYADDTPDILPLSRITIGMLEDLGFTVNYLEADDYLGFSSSFFESNLISENLVCFLEGTRLLVLDENLYRDSYIPIEQLKPGMLVYTHIHGYVPIQLIGKRSMFNPAIDKRIKDQLYVQKIPEYKDELVVTGCHSFLVDSLTTDQILKTRQLTGGKIFQTDGKFRLMACISEHPVYQHKGPVTIWHLALKHSDPHMNYGIFANGILVESCSVRMMEDYSDMDFIRN